MHLQVISQPPKVISELIIKIIMKNSNKYGMLFAVECEVVQELQKQK